MNFCPPAPFGVGSGSTILWLAEYQNRKIFFSLLKEKREREKLKKCRENFSVLLSRLVGWAETLGGIQSAKSSGFCSKKVQILSNKHHHLFTISISRFVVKWGKNMPYRRKTAS